MTQQDQHESKLPNNDNNHNLMMRKSGSKKLHPDKAAKHALRRLMKPSYGLCQGSRKLRSEHCARLTSLLQGLISQRNWTEAGGVLSVLLKATSKDKSVLNNRFKYSASMEIFGNIDDESMSNSRIKKIYDIWIRKIGSSKHDRDKTRSLVRLEFILFCLSQENLGDAYQAALWLMQESNFGRDPFENMVVGLTFYKLWFSTIPKEMLWTGDDEDSTPCQSEDLHACSEGGTRANVIEASTSFQCDSASSVRIDKSLASDDVGLNGGDLVRVDISKVENLPQNNLPHVVSAESTEDETSTANFAEISQYTSTLSALDGLNPSLFPIRLPQSIGNEDLYHLHMKLLNDYYKKALKYLKLALCMDPPAMKALLPFIQLLLVGGQVNEALGELDKLCRNPSSALPLRLRACILEHFDHGNINLLATCFEDILKKDPTCCHSLEKLIVMNRSGEYSHESLLKMIAWHLDSTSGSHDMWEELALCFLTLSENEEDRTSICQDGNQGKLGRQCSTSFSTIPKVLVQGTSGEHWKLRCRWWLNRHFNCDILASEIAAGDFQLLAYKAACASHIHGPELAYVVDAYTCLKKQNETDLLLFLEQNIEKSIQLYLTFRQIY